MAESKEGVKEKETGETPPPVEGVKKEAPPPKTDAVPEKNRASERERKRADEMEKKLARAQSEIDALKAAQKPPETDPEEQKARLQKFVEDPDAYIDGKVREARFKAEVPEAEAWLKRQEGYEVGDDTLIAQTIREFGIYGDSPRKRAEAAWNIIRAKRLEQELSGKREDTDREASVRHKSPEGGGKFVPQNQKPKRDEILRKIHAAERKGDAQTVAKLLGDLSDAPR